MKVDGVFAGGGVRGIAIIGALNYLESQGIEWERCAGTSSGSMVAVGLAAGYTAKELRDLMIQFNYKKVRQIGSYNKIPILAHGLGIKNDKGIYSGDYIEEWIEEILKAKGISTFKDFKIDGEYKVKIVVADITAKREVIIPDDLHLYNINPDEFKVATAVRMSSSIPVYFKPVILEVDGKKHYIVDGGITSNYPIEIFDNNKKRPILGFNYISNQGDEESTFNYILKVTETARYQQFDYYYREENQLRTINIDTKGIGITDFDIDRNKYLMLYRSGYKCAREFLSTWDEYINYMKDKEDVSE